MIKLLDIVEFITLMIFYVVFAIFGIVLCCAGYVVIDHHINTDISYKCADGKHIKVTLDKRRDHITEETLENVTCE